MYTLALLIRLENRKKGYYPRNLAGFHMVIGAWNSSSSLFSTFFCCSSCAPDDGAGQPPVAAAAFPASSRARQQRHYHDQTASMGRRTAQAFRNVGACKPVEVQQRQHTEGRCGAIRPWMQLLTLDAAAPGSFLRRSSALCATSSSRLMCSSSAALSFAPLAHACFCLARCGLRLCTLAFFL
jgi:hypothetical protein